ncbi:spondin domain-containing protein [Granulosicoccus sp.]|nr:spondin domain-containing protein [Granulosicoccus sp.]
MLGKKHVAAASLGLALALTTTLAQAQGLQDRTYRVEVTNILSAGQFTPILAVVHAPEIALFELGDEPTVGLATLAEGGDNSVLEASLSGLKEVAVAASFTPPSSPLTFAGETLEFEITVPANFRFISLAAMILPTNDSFFALDTVYLPNARPRSYFAKGYDAGSELNDELCANIPGPTCMGDGSFSGLNGEGFVHISPGISGQADLDSSIYDWRNPVAKVTITRVQ